MWFLKLQIVASLTSLQLCSGHYVYPFFVVNGVVSKVWEYVRRPTAWGLDHFDDENYLLSPLFDPFSTDIRCNFGALQAQPETRVASVNAGDEIGFKLFPGKTVYHPGPTNMWLSKAPGNVADYDGSEYWFKVYELGVSWNKSAIGYDRVHWNSSYQDQFTFKVPASTPPGQYLLRLEHSQMGAWFNSTQRWVNCAQVEINGPGGGTPSPLVKIPNAEMLFDRGQWVDLELYDSEKATEELVESYVIPYGPVWEG